MSEASSILPGTKGGLALGKSVPHSLREQCNAQCAGGATLHLQIPGLCQHGGMGFPFPLPQ
jgi:hypothetical protein